MFSKIIDSFCICNSQNENKANIIKINPPDSKINEKQNLQISSKGKEKKFLNQETHTALSIAPISNFPRGNSNVSQTNNKLTLLKLPEELIKKKIKLFGSGFNSKRKTINENEIFQNFQEKVDDIISECLKNRTYSESEDSENLLN